MIQIIRCTDCGTPVAEVRSDGTVRILSRHHGEQHVSEFRVKETAPPVKKGRV